MKAKCVFLLGMVSLCVVLCMSSCSQDDSHVDILSEKYLSGKIPMVFSSSKPSYETNSTRVAGSLEEKWEVGDTLFVEIEHKDSWGSWRHVLGRATISPATGKWEIEFSKRYETDTLGKAGTCRVWYIKGDYTDMGKDELYQYTFCKRVSQHNAIYVDKNAQYSYKDDKFTLIAGLSPLTSRVRFTSTKKTKIKIKGVERVRGIEYYNEPGSYGEPDYDGIYSVTRASQPLEISIDKQDNQGSYTSEYIYGLLTNDYNEFSMIDLADPEKVYFLKKSLLPHFLGAGLTGKILIPERTNHDGWEMKDNFIKTLADEISITKAYQKNSFSLGQVTGYGIRCYADLSSDHSWLRIYSDDPDKYHGYEMWSSYPEYSNKTVKEFLSLDIPYKNNYADNQTIVFEHYYSPIGVREKFTDIKLYYFSY